MGGGLEVAHIDGKQLILDEAVTAQGGLDVNYGMIDGSRFYVAATTYKEGAFLGYVQLANGLMGKSQLVTYPIDKTNPNTGIDANSVVKYKDNFVLATNKGYQVYNSTFTLRTPHLTTNDVKFVAVGNDKLYGLEAMVQQQVLSTSSITLIWKILRAILQKVKWVLLMARIPSL